MAQLGLLAGANDLGGTMFEESISKGAGASNTDYLDPAEMQRIAEDLRPDALPVYNSLSAGLISTSFARYFYSGGFNR